MNYLRFLNVALSNIILDTIAEETVTDHQQSIKMQTLYSL